MNYVTLSKVLTACLAIAPKNDVRYYLNGVHFMQDKNGLTIEASDGHQAVRFKSESKFLLDDESAHEEIDFILGKEEVAHFVSSLKLATKGALEETVKLTKGECYISFACAQILSADIATIDGKFPQIDRVIWKQPGAVEEVGLDARYLARLVKISKPFLGNKHNGLRCSFNGDVNSSMKTAFETLIKGLTVVILTMPCRL
jgi:DNA polymerase III sliding clamp (beta) subunit (PCNA family)